MSTSHDTSAIPPVLKAKGAAERVERITPTTGMYEQKKTKG